MSHPADIRFHRLMRAKIEAMLSEIKDDMASGMSAEAYGKEVSRYNAFIDVVRWGEQLEDELKGIAKRKEDDDDFSHS